MIIKIFQALWGDAISIRYLGIDEKHHNIIIDGGFAFTYPRTIKVETLEIISRKECIESFIITHIDQDHISGAVSFIKEFCDKSIVKEFWFNTDIEINISSSELISYKQAIKARDYLISKGQKTRSINNSLMPISIYGAKFTFFSPSNKNLTSFQKKWKNHEKNLISSESDYKLSVQELANKEFFEEKKFENLVSISFLFEYNDFKILFLADSQPTTIIKKLYEMGYTKSKKLKADYVKVSHHGSKGNTNYELLEIIDSKNYIISADGRNCYNLPHKEAMARIIHHNKLINQNICLIFNYNNEELKNIFSEEDKLEYENFTCLFPHEGENAYIIEF